MKNNLLLIAWQYQINKIPGLIIDTYRVYKYFLQLDYQISFITNILDEELPPEVIIQINNGELDRDILEFPEFLRNFYTEDVYTKLIQTSIICDNLVVYFSGHGEEETLILPNQNKISNSVLFQLATGRRNIFIVDCCNPGSLSYELVLEKFESKESKGSKESRDLPANILLIASSPETEKSLATKSGSLFTTSLFNYLQTVNFTEDITLITLVEKVSKATGQRVCCYSTIPILPLLPSFLYSQYDIILEEDCIKIY